MRIRGIVLATAMLVGAASAHADQTFESLAATTVPLSRADVGGLVWALTATCAEGDDLAQRQCKATRDGRLAEVKGATLLVDGDANAFQIGEWKADTKSLPVVLRGCIACVAPVGGLYLVSSKMAPSFKGATAEAAIVHETARTFKDEATARRWAARLGTMRTQFIVKLTEAAGGRWERDGKQGLAFDVLGYRVWDPCDGGIVCASPTSGKGSVDTKTCGESVAEGEVKPEVKPEDENLPAQLDAGDIKTAMKPVVEAAKACFDTYGVPGAARMIYTVGGDGNVMAFELTGDFVDTPTGKCIDKAAKAVTFPRSKKKKFGFTYPLNLQ